MVDYKEVERSILKKFRKEIWRGFTRSVSDYGLINEGDKIAVCISGGKDSMLLAKCMQELQKHGKFKFDLVYCTMDPGYNEINRQRIIDNAELLNIPLHIFDSQIFEVVNTISEGSPCYLCARMRRGYLYDNAKKLGCNKIALGHHFDDVIETILLSMMYGGEIKTMMPKLKSTNFEGMELIRPLYMVREESILNWMRYNNLTFINCACRFTESCESSDGSESKRLEIKNLIKSLKKVNPLVESNIFRSVENVHLNAIIAYKANGKKTSFLDEY